ncbi:carbamoyltransferase HypF [Celerinatantimonas sp. YJH-8]|uniref:carbamoyltransferase HypF n=1 Tax=Celerinatantimonas sp. YJH-8 TaxID=3228714 RepID=UPI0038BF8D78
MDQAVAIRICGTIQGVGFRPFVWRLAQRFACVGDVCNDGEGVLVRIIGPDLPLPSFIEALRSEAPPLARIQQIDVQSFDWPDPPSQFTIRDNVNSSMQTQISPDAATCPDCLNELFTPHNSRYRYPFINCTHCGPRFTLIEAMPYRRALTTMGSFALCSDCDHEYHDPADRRFHAQPNACPVCGPQLHWFSADAEYWGEAALQQTVKQLSQGQIIAVKGLGGFHLVCDALDQNAVTQLRLRKHRPDKPLAVMLPNRHWLEQIVLPEYVESTEQLLRDVATPIVLAPLRADSPLAPSIAPGLNEIGVLYPGHPLQHLLAHDLDRPLVMTSANVSHRAPPLDDQQIIKQLASVVDGVLGHNRNIVSRADDSVWRLAEPPFVIRRSRGYVPRPVNVSLPKSHRHTLALGGDLKNTFALLRQGEVVLSTHYGDLAQLSIQKQWQQALQHYQRLYQFKVEQIVVDAHPGYFSHQFGQQLARQLDMPVCEVYHHHAHVVAALSESGWPLDRPVIGLCLDGLGWGEGQQLWGGECLVADSRTFQRVGGLPPVALPGGDLCAKQPWRNLLAQWHAFVPGWSDFWSQQIAAMPAKPLIRAMEQGIQSPLASSTGRLFDAVATALNIAPLQLGFEGQAAMLLEQLAMQAGPCSQRLHIPLQQNNDQWQLDLASFWQQWLSCDARPAQKAWLFHDALAAGFALLARKAAEKFNISSIVINGGVMNNDLMRQRFREHLAGFELFIPHQFPAGDGALALGQAVIAASRSVL